MVIYSPRALLVFGLFVVSVVFQFRFEGKTLVLITPVPDLCYLFSYSQTLFENVLVYTLKQIYKRTGYIFMLVQKLNICHTEL